MSQQVTRPSPYAIVTQVAARWGEAFGVGLDFDEQRDEYDEALGTDLDKDSRAQWMERYRKVLSFAFKIFPNASLMWRAWQGIYAFFNHRFTKAGNMALAAAKALDVAPQKPRLARAAQFYQREHVDRVKDVVKDALEREAVEQTGRTEIAIRSNAVQRALESESAEFQAELDAARHQEYEMALAEYDAAMEALRTAKPTPEQLVL
jgi:hypothetical protein